MLRPPLAEDRLWRLANGRVRVALKRARHDGTTHLLFDQLEFLEKLAGLTPRAEINLVLYHGVLAPHARWRSEVVAFRRVDSSTAPNPGATAALAPWGGSDRPRYWSRVALMRRALDLDVLRCPRCAGWMRLIATIEDPAVIQSILAHLEFPGARDGPPPPAAVSAAPTERPALPYVTL